MSNVGAAAITLGSFTQSSLSNPRQVMFDTVYKRLESEALVHGGAARGGNPSVEFLGVSGDQLTLYISDAPDQPADKTTMIALVSAVAINTITAVTTNSTWILFDVSATGSNSNPSAYVQGLIDFNYPVT